MRETTNLKSGGEKRRKGSNKLASVALAGALLGPVTGQAQEVKEEESQQNQKEMVVEDSTKDLTGTTIKFENAKELKNIDSIVDILMGLEVVQERLKVYGEDVVKKTLKGEASQAIEKLRGKYSDEYVNRTIFYVVKNTDIRSKDLDKIIKDCVKSEEFQEAYKKGDEDTMLRIIEEYQSWESFGKPALIFLVVISSISAVMYILSLRKK